MEKGKSGRSLTTGSSSSFPITHISAAYTVLPTDRVIECSGTGTYTVTLCNSTKFPANETLFIYIGSEGVGEVTVATPSGGIISAAGVANVFTQDGLTALDDFMLLQNIHGVQWVQLKEVTT